LTTEVVFVNTELDWIVMLSQLLISLAHLVESSWNVMAHGDAREEKWRGNWRMEWVASTLHTTSEHSVSSTTTTDAQTSAASSPLNWRPRWFKWTSLFCWKTKSGFCACAITFQLDSTVKHRSVYISYRLLSVPIHTVSPQRPPADPEMPRTNSMAVTLVSTKSNAPISFSFPACCCCCAKIAIWLLAPSVVQTQR